MKKNIASIFVMGISIASLTLLNSCGSKTEESTTTPSTEETTDLGRQSAVKDDDSQKDIVKVASESADHPTLVAAIKAAEYVDVLSNAGPFTVFAPTNDAFNKLPEGTVETLVKPENKDKLRDILEYHVAVAVYKTDMFKDGQIINMANLGNVKISIKNGEIFINETAKIIGTVPSSNGIIHVIDNVLLEKK